MEVTKTKTVKCKLIGLTNRKFRLLNQKYDNFRHYLKTGLAKTRVSILQQSNRVRGRTRKSNPMKTLVIRKDLMEVRRTSNKTS